MAKKAKEKDTPNPAGPGVEGIFNEPVRYSYPGFPGDVRFTYLSQRNFDPAYAGTQIPDGQSSGMQPVYANKQWAQDDWTERIPKDFIRDAVGVGTSNQVYRNALGQILPNMDREYPSVVLMDAAEKWLKGAGENILAWYDPSTKEVYHPIAGMDDKDKEVRKSAITGDLINKSLDLGAYGYMFHPEVMQNDTVAKPYITLSDKEKFYLQPASLSHEIGHRYDEALGYPLAKANTNLWPGVIEGMYSAYAMNPRSMEMLNFTPETPESVPGEMFSETFRDSLMQQIAAPENQARLRDAYEKQYGTPYPVRFETPGGTLPQPVLNLPFQQNPAEDARLYAQLISGPSKQYAESIRQQAGNTDGLEQQISAPENITQYKILESAMKDAYAKKPQMQALTKEQIKSIKKQTAKQTGSFIPALSAIPVEKSYRSNADPLYWVNLFR